MTSLGWLLLTLLPASSGAVVTGNSLSDDPPIKLWMNNSREFREGDAARVEVETQYDGYLVVLNYATDGRVRVLFPIEPGDDHFVRAGRRYQVQGRRDRESFVVGREGDGIVYAAVSADPFDFREIESGGKWDYTRVSVDDRSDDPEADITDLLERISTDRGFDYDVLSYRVWDYRGYHVTTAWYPRPHGFYDDYWCDWYYRPSLFGCRYWYPRSAWYGGYWSTYGYYDPYWGYRNPWRQRHYYAGNRSWPVVVGRPRGYTIVRRSPNDSRVARSPGSYAGGSFGGSRPSVIDYRPRNFDGRSRPGREDGPSASRPSSDQGSSRPAATNRPRARRAEPRRDDGKTGSDRVKPNVDRGKSGSVDRGKSGGKSEPKREGRSRGRRSENDGDAPQVNIADERADRGSSDGRPVIFNRPREINGDAPRVQVPNARRAVEDVDRAEAPRGRAVESTDRAEATRGRPAERIDRGNESRARPSDDVSRRSSHADVSRRSSQADESRAARPRQVDPPRQRVESSTRRDPPASTRRADPPRRDSPRSSSSGGSSSSGKSSSGKSSSRGGGRSRG